MESLGLGENKVTNAWTPIDGAVCTGENVGLPVKGTDSMELFFIVSEITMRKRKGGPLALAALGGKGGDEKTTCPDRRSGHERAETFKMAADLTGAGCGRRFVVNTGLIPNHFCGWRAEQNQIFARLRAGRTDPPPATLDVIDWVHPMQSPAVDQIPWLPVY